MSDGGDAVHGLDPILGQQLDALPTAVEVRDHAGALVHANPAAVSLRQDLPALGAGSGEDLGDTPTDGPRTPGGGAALIDVDGTPLTAGQLPAAACLADGGHHELTVGVGPAREADDDAGDDADHPAADDPDHDPGTAPAATPRRWLRVHAAPAPLPGGHRGVLVTYLDVTTEHHLAEQLRLAALHDPLTGLPNRRLLAVRFSQAQASAARSGDHVGLVYLDLDRFRTINDVHGHGAGDRFLHEFGTRLDAVTRDADTAARVGGDEFVVLCTQLDSALSLQTAASRIANAVDGTVVLNGRRATLGASVGWVLVGRDMDLDTALNQADTAMYRDRARRSTI